MGGERVGSGQLNVLTAGVFTVLTTATSHSSSRLYAWTAALIGVAIVVAVIRGPRGRGGSRAWYRKKYLRSPHWRARRARSIALAGNRCERCGRGGSLDVHHRSYARLGRERDRDLRVLCRDCHDREHHPLLALLRALVGVARRTITR